MPDVSDLSDIQLTTLFIETTQEVVSRGIHRKALEMLGEIDDATTVGELSAMIEDVFPAEVARS